MSIIISMEAQNVSNTDDAPLIYDINYALSHPLEVKKLDLSNQKIDFTSIDFSVFKNLEYLRLINDNLYHLPLGIKDLSNLKILDISSNKFCDIPHELKEMPNLEELIFNNEQYISDVSSFEIFLSMTSLKRLHLDSIDSKVIDRIPFAPQLQYLSLKYDGLSNIPISVSTIKDLRKLDLEGNNIRLINPELTNLNHLEDISLGLSKDVDLTIAMKVLGNIPTLKSLHFDNSKFKNFNYNIPTLNNVEYLSFKNTHLISFPTIAFSFKNLRVLDLTGNDFSDLPTGLASMDKLEELFLTNDFKLNMSQAIRTLAKVSSLKKLHLENYTISSLPFKISDLPQLSELYLKNNILMSPHYSHNSYKRVVPVPIERNLVYTNNSNTQGFGLRWRLFNNKYY